MSGKLIISRRSERDLKIRGIELFLDGKFVGDLTYGSSLEIETESGKHTLRATNKLKSALIDFEVAAGETVRVETVGIALGGIWAVMAMLGTVAYRVTLECVS